MEKQEQQTKIVQTQISNSHVSWSFILNLNITPSLTQMLVDSTTQLIEEKKTEENINYQQPNNIESVGEKREISTGKIKF